MTPLLALTLKSGFFADDYVVNLIEDTSKRCQAMKWDMSFLSKQGHILVRVKAFCLKKKY